MNDEKTNENSERIFLCPEIVRFKDKLSEAMAGESSRAFAARCGLSDTVIRNYLAGKTYPSLDRLAMIAKASGKTIQWFILDSDELNSNKKTQSHEIGNIYAPSSQELQGKLLSILNLLSNDELSYAVELFRRKGFEALMPKVIACHNDEHREGVLGCGISGCSTSTASPSDDPLTQKKVG